MALCIDSLTSVGSALLACSVASAQCGYTIQKAPPVMCGINGIAASPEGMNDITVAGYYKDCNLDDTQGFFWSGVGPLVTIAPPRGAGGIFVTDLSAGGSICGGVWVPGSPSNGEGFLLDAGVYTLLGAPPQANSSLATALNDSVVVGKWANSQNIGPKAFVWSKGVMTTLNLPMGPNHEAKAVNQRGQIAGWMGSSVVSNNHAFLYQDAIVTDLGALPGGSTASPTSINNLSEIAGYGKVFDPASGASPTHGFVWSEGVFFVIGMLPGYALSGASDINDQSVAVGICTAPLQWERGFVWRDGVMTDLNDLIPSNSGIMVKTASSINNAGQIACEAQDLKDIDGSQPYIVLLTPIPPIPGDTNCNKIVDVDDLLTVINGWGTCKKFSPCPGDLLENDVVDVDDLLLVINNWSSTQ